MHTLLIGGHANGRRVLAYQCESHLPHSICVPSMASLTPDVPRSIEIKDCYRLVQFGKRSGTYPGYIFVHQSIADDEIAAHLVNAHIDEPCPGYVIISAATGRIGDELEVPKTKEWLTIKTAEDLMETRSNGYRVRRRA